MPLAPFNVTVCGIPELEQHSGAGVTHLLSIMNPDEPRPPALDLYGPVDHEMLRFHDVVAEYHNFEPCTEHHIERLLQFGERAHRKSDGHVLVHCRGGISRSTAAAAILMAQYAPGEEKAAFLKLLNLRIHVWPNTRMVEFADQLLGRKGAMLKALRECRRAALRKQPIVREMVRNANRAHELPKRR
jgi:predicted protein tyrosine phosphatase